MQMGGYNIRCSECGEYYRKDDPHECDPEKLAGHEINKLDGELKKWLATKEGEFAVYYAERRRSEYMEQLALEIPAGGVGSSGVSGGEEAKDQEGQAEGLRR